MPPTLLLFTLLSTMLPTAAIKKKTTGKRLESLKFAGGSKFMKELQKTVFFAAYESVVFSSGKSVTDKEQKEMLRRSILGSEDPDVISLPEQMVLGVNQFAHLYDDVPMESNDDRNATSVLGRAGTDNLIGSSHRTEYDKRLKDCFFPQKSSGGKLHIYANKPDGITKSLLIAKNLSNPVDVSVQTIMRAAKEVVRNGRKALACVKEAKSDYKDGTLPSGRTISDYHRYVRERMFVKLKGTSGADYDDADADDDGVGSGDVEKDDQNGNQPINPDEMPEDYYFSGMIAFFLWGYIIEDPNQECYRSKQFQIGDSAPEEKGLHSRRQIKKEAARAESKQRDIGAATPGSPFKRGASLSQQIEIAKLHAARSFEAKRTLDNEYTIALQSIQKDIDHHMDLAKLWGANDRNDPIYSTINELFEKKRKLSVTFAEKQCALTERRQITDTLIDDALGDNASKKKRSKNSTTSSISSTGTAALTTPSSSRGGGITVPTPTSLSTTAEEDSPRTQERGEAFECIQPPPSFIFPSQVNDDCD